MESFSAQTDDHLLIDYHAPSDTLYVRYNDQPICYSDMIYDDLILNLNADKAIVGAQILGATSGRNTDIRLRLELFGPEYHLEGNHIARGVKLAKRVQSIMFDLNCGRKKPTSR